MRNRARSAEDLLDRAEARATERLRGDLLAVKSGALSVLGSSALRHPVVTLAVSALAGAVAAPLLLRVLRSSGRALWIARVAVPFVRDFWRGTGSSHGTGSGSSSRHATNGSTR